MSNVDLFFQDAGRVEKLKPAITKLLQTVPETWTECDPASLPLEEQDAYRLLTAVGTIERRGWLRFGMANHPACFEVQFQATGVGAFADAMGWVVAKAYAAWRDAWRAWRAANHDDDPYYHDPFRVEAASPQEVRLLFGKILLAACSGVSASSLPKSEVIQRYVDTLTGKPVHGRARLLRLRECDSTAAAGGEGNRVDWFAVTLKAMLNQHFLDDRNPPDATEGASMTADLLRRVPNAWAEVPEDAQGDALAALTAAGFVAHRITFTVRMPGSDETNRVTIEMTGEYGFAEAMEAAIQDLWTRYGQRWRELRRDIREPVRPIVSRQSDEWKLTPDGRTALADLERGLTTPLDFALKRDFFDGRLPVRGCGRLVSLENAPSGPLSVAVANWGEASEAFARAFGALQSAAGAGDGEARSEPASDPNREKVLTRLLKLIAGRATDDALQRAVAIILSEATVNDKLHELSEIMPSIERSSCRALATLLDVTHKAVIATQWWKRNRKGENRRKVADRETRLKERGRVWEREPLDDDQ